MLHNFKDQNGESVDILSVARPDNCIVYNLTSYRNLYYARADKLMSEDCFYDTPTVVYNGNLYLNGVANAEQVVSNVHKLATEHYGVNLSQLSMYETLVRLRNDLGVCFISISDAIDSEFNQCVLRLALNEAFMGDTLSCMYELHSSRGMSYGLFFEGGFKQTVLFGADRVQQLIRVGKLKSLTNIKQKLVPAGARQFKFTESDICQVDGFDLHGNTVVVAFTNIPGDIISALANTLSLSYWCPAFTAICTTKEILRRVITQSNSRLQCLSKERLDLGVAYALDTVLGTCNVKDAYCKKYNISESDWSAEVERLTVLFDVQSEEELYSKLNLLL